MLHNKITVCILYGLGDHGALYIPAIYKKVFEIPVAAADGRLPEIAGNMDPAFPVIHLNQIGGHLASIDAVDHIFQPAITRCP